MRDTWRERGTNRGLFTGEIDRSAQRKHRSVNTGDLGIYSLEIL